MTDYIYQSGLDAMLKGPKVLPHSKPLHRLPLESQPTREPSSLTVLRESHAH